jgi:hypothetical protein
VFRKPFKVVPKFETKETPSSYIKYAPPGKVLGKQMQVWRVQDTGNRVGKAGSVSPGYTCEYPGEAEVISPGFAPGKPYDSVGIGRHGNFLLWGYSAPPSKMTPAGLKLFVNCICYIRGFGGKPFARIPQIARDRTEDMPRIFSLMFGSPRRAKSYPPRFFPPEVLKRFGGDLKRLHKHYQDNIEFVRVDNYPFLIDEELKALGVSSNRKIATLEKLIELLETGDKAELAQKLLLRYTTQKHESAAEWQAWLTKNRGQLVFSDKGGYKFYVVPKID